MLWEILKASKGLPVDDLFAALWGKKIAVANDWQLTTLTGTLPLSFKSKGEALTDYKLYGTSDGAGVETEAGEPTGYKIPILNTSGVTDNLFDKDAKDTEKGYVNSKYFNSSGEIVAGVYNISEYIKVEPNQNYTIYYGATTTTPALCLYDAEKTRVSIISYNASPMVITTTSETMYMRISVKTNTWDRAYVVKGSTPPPSYIPYLQPTDPPVPLPEISTYEGENVISFDDGIARTADSNPEHPQLQADLSLPTKQSNVLYFFREFANVTDSTASQREVYVITKSILPKLDYINIHFWENGSIVQTIKTTSWYTGQNIDGMRPMFPPEGYAFIIVTLNKVPINRFPFQSTIEMIYKEAGNG